MSVSHEGFEAWNADSMSMLATITLSIIGRLQRTNQLEKTQRHAESVALSAYDDIIMKGVAIEFI